MSPEESLKDVIAEIPIELSEITCRLDELRELHEERPTLRDQFAMAAMAALVTRPDLIAEGDNLARFAYEIADEMLKYRKETT